MKKLILAAVAASVVAAPAVAAPGSSHNDRGRAEQVQRGKHSTVVRNDGRQTVTARQVVQARNGQARQVQARNWRNGERFDSRYATNYRLIQNPHAYRLYDAPRGYRWVQSNNDAVLVAITSGIIGAVLGNVL